MTSATERRFMERALTLAAKASAATEPNPRVGCVLVRDHQIVGEGWHQRVGAAHAEVVAIDAARSAARGATAYVTLEPCSHHGRTPPCAQALIDAQVDRVVIAMMDPDPRVSGSGVRQLTAAGISVHPGLLEAEARHLNRAYLKRTSTGLPWVTVKMAASLDGRSAAANGESQWITGKLAREDGHRRRAAHGAILTGMGTVRRDNPSLTVRHIASDYQPLRVVVDSQSRISMASKIFASPGRILVVTAADIDETVPRACSNAITIERIKVKKTVQGVDLKETLSALPDRGINSVLVEAGPTLAGEMLVGGLVDSLVYYVAPCLLGGAGTPAFWLAGHESLAQRVRLSITAIVPLGDDWLIEAQLS